MSATTITHDGTLYALLRASCTNDASNTEACLIELTAEQVREWRDRLTRAAQMQAEHGVSYAAWTDVAPSWRGVEFEAEPLDEDEEVFPPAWGDDERRTEVDRVEVDQHGLTFTCFVKGTSDRLTAYLYREDIDGLEAALNSQKGVVRT